MENLKNRREELHEILCDALGSTNVYFQPPESIRMKYPAIVYQLDYIRNQHADDGVYSSRKRYAITVITTNPDDTVIDRVARIPTSQFNRHYVVDNLYHDVFTIFY